MDLKTLKDKTKPITVEFDGQELKLEIYPNRRTMAYSQEVAEVQANPNTTRKDVIEKVFLPLIAGWNLTDGENALQVTGETLTLLPAELINAIDTAIFGKIEEPEVPKP